MTVTQAPRKTRFRLGANLGRAGLDPQDLFGKFPSDSSHVISSPFPELCSAHATFTISPLLIYHRCQARSIETGAPTTTDLRTRHSYTPW